MLLDRLVSLPSKNLNKHRITIYLGCYTSDFMDQVGKPEDTIYNAAEKKM